MPTYTFYMELNDTNKSDISWTGTSSKKYWQALDFGKPTGCKTKFRRIFQMERPIHSDFNRHRCRFSNFMYLVIYQKILQFETEKIPQGKCKYFQCLRSVFYVFCKINSIFFFSFKKNVRKNPIRFLF